MKWRGFFIVISFCLAMFASFAADIECRSSCVSEKTKIEEHCLLCACTRRGIEAEKALSLKSSTFLYQIPEFRIVLQNEKEFVDQRMKPPNLFFFV